MTLEAVGVASIDPLLIRVLRPRTAGLPAVEGVAIAFALLPASDKEEGGREGNGVVKSAESLLVAPLL